MATWTQTDVDALKAAVSSGVLSVEYQGPPTRKITYQSLGDMRRLLAEMVAQVQGAAGNRQTFRLGGTSKGFDVSGDDE